MSDSSIDRREFLRRGALAGASVGLLPLGASAALAALEPPRVKAQRTLGRTGLRVSDIGFGSFGLDGDVPLVRHALERGITYFDTAESYPGRALGGDARERAAGLARSASCSPPRSPPTPDATRDVLMQALDGSLRRLRTDRIDVYFNHAVNDPARVLKNPEWPEFVSRAKQAGKLRFSGDVGAWREARRVPRLRARPARSST